MFGSRGQRARQTQQAFVLAAGTTMPSVASLGRTSSLPGIHMALRPENNAPKKNQWLMDVNGHVSYMFHGREKTHIFRHTV